MLQGSPLTIDLSDPFEISGQYSGVVAAVHTFADGAELERVLVELSAEVEWDRRRYGYVVLSGRYTAGLVDELLLGERVHCNGIGVSEQAASLPPPWGAAAWRGGLSLIGAVAKPVVR